MLPAHFLFESERFCMILGVQLDRFPHKCWYVKELRVPLVDAKVHLAPAEACLFTEG